MILPCALVALGKSDPPYNAERLGSSASHSSVDHLFNLAVRIELPKNKRRQTPAFLNLSDDGLKDCGARFGEMSQSVNHRFRQAMTRVELELVVTFKAFG